VGVFLIVHAAMSAAILALHLALAVGLCLNFLRERRLGAAKAPDAPALRAEVVVALRNEEATLPRLLESLRGQTLAGCRFLFVDDRSTDATSRLLDEFCRATGPFARVIHVREEAPALTGKQSALDRAFADARGEVLLFTDGDCRVPSTWAAELLRHFRDPRVGVVLGRIELAEGRSFLERFQAFEQPLINQYNLSSAGIGLPIGCFGNNMAVRAAAVKETGGFKAMGRSVTEDAMLLGAVSRGGGWKVKVCTSEGGAVTTIAQRRWRAYVDQHTRWNAGGLFSPDTVTRLCFILVVLVYLVGSLVVLPLGFADWRVPLLSLNSFLSIGILAGIGGCYEGKHRARYFLRLLPYLFFFGFFYSFITLRALFRRPFEWKGATLRP